MQQGTGGFRRVLMGVLPGSCSSCLVSCGVHRVSERSVAMTLGFPLHEKGLNSFVIHASTWNSASEEAAKEATIAQLIKEECGVQLHPFFS
jgi:hypothetical protein